GALTYRLSHPRHAVPRLYHVAVEGRADAAALTALRRGVLLDDGPARADAVRRLGPAERGGAWLELAPHEGRHREVRRLCRAVGLEVRQLCRVAFGPIRLGRLGPGAWRELTARERAALGVDAETPGRVAR